MTMGRKRMSNTARLSLDDENFGERVHRAYRQGRAAHGFTYREIAERLSTVYPVSMQSLQRIEAQAEIPRQPRMRLVAYLALIAYGFEPEDFGLNHDNTPVGFIDLAKAKSVLDPNNGCSRGSEQPHVAKNIRKSPGQRKIGSSARAGNKRNVA